jgi:hypothetical protein
MSSVDANEIILSVDLRYTTINQTNTRQTDVLHEQLSVHAPLALAVISKHAVQINWFAMSPSSFHSHQPLNPRTLDLRDLCLARINCCAWIDTGRQVDAVAASYMIGALCRSCPE